MCKGITITIPGNKNTNIVYTVRKWDQKVPLGHVWVKMCENRFSRFLIYSWIRPKAEFWGIESVISKHNFNNLFKIVVPSSQEKSWLIFGYQNGGVSWATAHGVSWS